jgi:hypothetical protein
LLISLPTLNSICEPSLQPNCSPMETIMPSQLLPSLAIPFVEIFPNLCLGWWAPPSLKLKQYASNGLLRVLLQIISWYPVVSVDTVRSQNASVLWLLGISILSTSLLFLYIIISSKCCFLLAMETAGPFPYLSLGLLLPLSDVILCHQCFALGHKFTPR